MKQSIMTVDLETDCGLDRCKSIEIALPKLLDLFDDYKISATFFAVTKLLDNYEDEIKDIYKKHEIASHSHSHNSLSAANAELEISTSMAKFKECKIKCIGFRSPRFIVPENQFTLLKKYGYKYDSSLATLFPFRYNNLFLSQKPFVKQGIIELPMPTFVYPLINSGLSYLKLFHPISKFFPKAYMFYLHPWEFLEKKDLPKKGIIGRLLRRNTGKRAEMILSEYISTSNCKFVSCEEYIKSTYNEI